MIPHVAAVVPAYNAAATLVPVLQGLRAALPEAVLIVVDDGSTDATSDVARPHANTVIRHSTNQGKGAALRTGFATALDRQCAMIVTCDADGQHDPACAPILLEALSGADFVIGTRWRAGSSMPPHRRLANSLSSAAISICAGRRITDPQSGYRAIRATVLRAVDAPGDRYEYETELLIHAARAGFTVTEVPIPTIYGAASHFRTWSDTARVIAAIWRHRNVRAGASIQATTPVGP